MLLLRLSPLGFQTYHFFVAPCQAGRPRGELQVKMRRFLLVVGDKVNIWEVDDKRTGGSHGNEITSQREREMSLRDMMFAASFLQRHFSCSVSLSFSYILHARIYLSFFLSPPPFFPRTPRAGHSQPSHWLLRQKVKTLS